MTFQELEASFHQQMQPKGSAEVAVFRQFVNAAWNLRSISDQEHQLAELARKPLIPLDLAKIQEDLARIQRRRSLAENVFYRCLNRLTRLRDERLRRSAAQTITPQRLARLRAPIHIM